jgi:hypothetical protein
LTDRALADSGIGKKLCLKSRPSEQGIGYVDDSKMGEAAEKVTKIGSFLNRL